MLNVGRAGTMKDITSRHNSTFKALLDLVGSARERRPHGRAWCEGERLCQGLLAVPPRTPWTLVAADHDTCARVPRAIAAVASEILVLTPSLFNELTQLDTPSGWALVVPAPLAAFAPSDVVACGRHDTVILDRLQDPGNAGTILRSAAAAGIRQIWSVTGTVDLWSPKVMRSAMGAHAMLEIFEPASEGELIREAQARGLPLLATALAPDAVSLFSAQLDLTAPVAWVLGQEADGVSDGFLARARCITIPMATGVESLNVAAAASVCFFEARRRRQR